VVSSLINSGINFREKLLSKMTNYVSSGMLNSTPLTHLRPSCSHGSIPKRPIAKTAPKILISKKIVQNGPLHCPKRPIIQPKRPVAKSKTAHSYIQNGPLSLSAFGNVQSDLEILYVEASYTYTRVRGLDDSETVKCSAMHYGVTCSKFKSVNATFPTQI